MNAFSSFAKLIGVDDVNGIVCVRGGTGVSVVW